MLNILKAILRQTVRDKLLWGGGIYILATVLIQIIADSSLLRGTGSETFCSLGALLVILLPIAAGWVTARACGADLRDKTANYEVLFGKKRSAVYFGRFFAALIIMIAVTLLVPLVCVGCMTLKNGWGGSFAFSNMLLHLGMVFPILFRLVCFFTALSFVSGNDLVPMALAFVGTMALILASFLMEESGVALSWHTGVADLKMLLDFTNTTSGFLDGKEITVYKAALSGGTILRMLCTSFGIGLCWLFGGYACFRKRDIS